MIPLLTEQDVRKLLLSKTETENLDFKEGLNWNKGSKDERFKVIKDILAMSNTKDGGKIILGVKDKTFDQTPVNQLLHSYADPEINCQIYKYVIDGRNTVVIDVPEFIEIPTICKKSAHSTKDNKKLILQEGAIYIRTKSAESISIPNSQVMREFLTRAVIRRGDELLSNIKKLITGKPLPSSDESKKKIEEEIIDASRFLEGKIGEELKKFGFWEIYAYPTQYKENRIEDFNKIKELVERSEVMLRGWNFPHTDHENVSNFNDGQQSFTIWGKYSEGYRLYRSGFFVWKRAFWEDIESWGGKSRKALSFISAIWSMTEFFLFFKRLYEELLLDGDVHIKIILNGCDERELIALDPGVAFRPGNISKEDKIIAIDSDIKVVELKTSYKEIALKSIKRVFHIFNWIDIRDEIIDQWQIKLIERKI